MALLAAFLVAGEPVAESAEAPTVSPATCAEIRDATMAPFLPLLAAKELSKVRAAVKSACRTNLDLAGGEKAKLDDLDCAKPRLLIDKNIRAAQADFDQACLLINQARAASAECANGQARCLLSPGGLFAQAAGKIKQANSRLDDTAKLLPEYARKSKERASYHAVELANAALRAACKDPQNVGKDCGANGNAGLNSDLSIPGLEKMTLGQYLARFEDLPNPSPEDVRARALRLGSWSPTITDEDPRKEYGGLFGEEIKSTQDARNFQALWESSRPKFESLASNVESLGATTAGGGTRLASAPAAEGPAPESQLSRGESGAHPFADVPGNSVRTASLSPAGNGTGASQMIAGARRAAFAPARILNAGKASAPAPLDPGTAPDAASPAAASPAGVGRGQPEGSAPGALAPGLAGQAAREVVPSKKPGIELSPETVDDPGALLFGGRLKPGPLGTGSSSESASRSAKGEKTEQGGQEFPKSPGKRGSLADRLRRALAEKGRSAEAGEATVRELLAQGSAFTGELPEKTGARIPFSMSEAETERELRRLEDENAGLLGADSAALFLRVHDTHLRLLKRGQLWEKVSVERAAAN